MTKNSWKAGTPADYTEQNHPPHPKSLWRAQRKKANKLASRRSRYSRWGAAGKKLTAHLVLASCRAGNNVSRVRSPQILFCI